jgi:hypothetical protein
LPQSEASPEDAAPLRGIQRGAYPKKERPKTLAALQYQLKNETRLRGLIVKGGEVVESNIVYVDFQPDPVPVASVVIRYYKAK